MPDATISDGVDAVIDEAEHRLADDERQVPVEAVAQALLQVRDGVVLRTRGDEDVVQRDAHVEAPRVVGPEVERAPGLEVELRVVPVTREQSRLDRALVEREPHVRAAVLDRPRAVVVPEHDHGDRADLGEELALTPEVEQRAGTDLGGIGHGSQRTTSRRNARSGRDRQPGCVVGRPPRSTGSRARSG